MIYLMNSAMMPQEGKYEMRRIGLMEFIEMVQNNPFKSYIGYPTTAAFIKKVTGREIPINREKTAPLKRGDILLVCKLKYRLKDPRMKGKLEPGIQDFEFFEVKYLGQQD